jgi:hypothetical protein
MRVLHECLLNHYGRSGETLRLNQLIEILRKAEEDLVLRGWAESIEAVISRLSFLTSGKLRKTFNCQHGILNLKDTLEAATVIDLSSLEDARVKNLVPLVFC